MSFGHSFANKKVLITGGGQGIGRQLVQRFHDDGAIVFTVDKNPETVAALKQELPKVTAEIVDLSEWDATKRVVESFGVIDHLINCAGMIVFEPFLNLTKETITTHFNVNLLAMINVSQVVAKGLIGAGKEGSIVNISSAAAKRGSPGGSVYGATKAGMENMTKSMAMELGHQNIRVNAIVPGFVKTPIHDALDIAVFDAYKKQFFDRMVTKRMIEPNEVADLAMFLLSPLSKMCIGQSYVIDGGYLLQ